MLFVKYVNITLGDFMNLKKDEEVLVFYHSVEWGPCLTDYTHYEVGNVVSVQELRQGLYSYEVVGNNGNKYFGLHGIPSKSNYLFLTKEEYLYILKNQIKYLEYEKNKYQDMVEMIERKDCQK